MSNTNSNPENIPERDYGGHRTVDPQNIQRGSSAERQTLQLGGESQLSRLDVHFAHGTWDIDTFVD